jgi:Transposase IS116/IS110/IS902 family
VLTAGVLLAEIGDCRARYQTRDSLAAHAGQAAVAIQSGKHTAACFGGDATKDDARRSADWPTAPATGIPGPKTTTPLLVLAVTITPALRTLGRAWSRIIWRCWQDHARYDAALHRALQHHITVTIPAPPDGRADIAGTQRMAAAAVAHTPVRKDRAHTLDHHTAGVTTARLDTGRLLLPAADLKQQIRWTLSAPAGTTSKSA